ncbi:MAG: hypothetical protein ACRD9R_12395 [Pyrinomonadaceae bacterium]
METGEYRREYAAYRTEYELARYNYISGRTPKFNLAPLEDRYAALWTREVIADLQNTHDKIHPQFETERTALRTLAAAARLGFVEVQTRALSRELEGCEAANSLPLDDGGRVSPREAVARIAHESDAARRRELTANWLERVRACEDLRAAHLDARDEAARTLDFENYFALSSDVERSPAEETLRASVESLPRLTDEIYRARLAAWAVQHLPTGGAREMSFADGLFFRRLSSLESFFPSNALKATYRQTLAGLGVRIESQQNLRLEESVRNAAFAAAAVCCPVNPPEDVRLLYRVVNGADTFRRFYQEAGRAQSFAWASRDLATHYPELVFQHSSATVEGHAFLFRFLLHDPAWLAEHRELKASEAQAGAGAFALVELHDARRCAAALCFRGELIRAAADPRSEHLSETYEATFREATGFSHPRALSLFDADNSLSPAVGLRARLFAASLGEYLRTRHGRRWWVVRRAGDELIDLWNTASRYTPEEQAALIGAPALDAELLAAGLSETLNEN